MSSRFAFSTHDGAVVKYDAQAGHGDVTDGEFVRPFHCTQIDGGSRTIPISTPVTFDVVAGLPGRWEAVRVRARSGSFLCPVCATPVAGQPCEYEICGACGWEDDPLQRDDQHYAGGANKASLHEARTAVMRAHIEAATGESAPHARG